MMTLEQIRHALTDRKISTVAERAGLHQNTVYAIARGGNANPEYATLKALSDYLTNNNQEQ